MYVYNVFYYYFLFDVFYIIIMRGKKVCVRGKVDEPRKRDKCRQKKNKHETQQRREFRE